MYSAELGYHEIILSSLNKQSLFTFLNTRNSLHVCKKKKRCKKWCYTLSKLGVFLNYILSSAYEPTKEEVLWKDLTLRWMYDTKPDWITRYILTTNVFILGYWKYANRYLFLTRWNFLKICYNWAQHLKFHILPSNNFIIEVVNQGRERGRGVALKS